MSWTLGPPLGNSARVVFGEVFGDPGYSRPREHALRTAFRTIRREVWTYREAQLRRALTDKGENWMIA